MGEEARYAIYFVPPVDSRLYQFGCSILGYDCYTGEAAPRSADFGVAAADWDKLTEEPRRYGFHATLKAPFHLSRACTEGQLIGAVHGFAGLSHSVPTIAPIIRMLSGFAAIVPERHEAAIGALATKCTTMFDGFRAPTSPQERAQRLALGLNERQIQNLDRWGYPFLFSEFRFHLTLTGKIRSDRCEEVLASLRRTFDRTCGSQPIAIDRLALMRQDDRNANFRVILQAPLMPAA